MSAHQIDVNYARLKSEYAPDKAPENAAILEKMTLAHKCLKRQRCRD